MTPREMQSAFELEINKYDSELMLESHVIFYWLNESQTRYFKTRYSGINPKQEGFEQSQKRIDDLRTLIVEESINTTAGSLPDKPNSFIAILPVNYVFTVGEEAVIQYGIPGSLNILRTEVCPITSDTYSREVENPFGKHRLHYEKAKPLRLSKGNIVELITDGTYTVNSYFLRYIKMPLIIELGGPDCELPEHSHTEIVTNAVSMVLENLGDQRYQSNKTEVQEQE